MSITLEEVFLSGLRGNICVQNLEIQERRGCNVHVIVWNHIHTLNIHIIHSHLLQLRKLELHLYHFHSNANHKINSQSHWSDFVSHIITCTVQAQPRPQGLLLDDFQNGGSTGEDPGKGWYHVVQNLQKSWRFLSRDILRKAKAKWRRIIAWEAKHRSKNALTLYTRQWWHGFVVR